ncbi:carbon-nitrogen hydrolase family protein [Prosthecomicrobium sp. N25]|uniref:carbon-nitrogen hydrolase family protein n=1 Tax=Prosthecomicrobium sp. N25 TaxID=3129254 RepID=UPI003077FCFF
MTSEPFRIGAVAIGPAGRDPAPLRAEAEAGIRRAAGAGARLVVLPELFAWPYAAAEDPAAWPVAEPGDGPTSRWAARLAIQHEVGILWGAAIERTGGLPVNAARLARPDGRVETVAAKIHLPPASREDLYGEADHFSAGPPRVTAFTFGPVRVAPLVCYDRRFPECWGAAAAAGADVVAVLVAGPAPGDPPGFFRGELATHARSNAVYAIAAARFGTETVTGRPVAHDGETVAVRPDGHVVLAAAPPGEPLVLLDVDAGRLAAARDGNPTARRLRVGGAPTQDPAFQGETPWQN